MADKTIIAVTNQIQAMGCDVFEVGLFKPTATGKEPVMLPRTWDADTLLRSIFWLRHQNREDRNIYIRPKGEHNLSLVDDLKWTSVQAMKTIGFEPALVVQTSPGNFQVWVKHPQALDKETGTAAARALAQKFDGDIGAADWRHFGRLAGFTNRKEKYKGADGLYPFVLLMEHPGIPYQNGSRFLSEIKVILEQEQEAKKQLAGTVMTGPHRPSILKSIDGFRHDPKYGGDGTRIDLAYAVYAFAHGASTLEVSAALRSRDLSHKGNEKRQEDYVQRTIQKALGGLRTEVRAR